MSKRVNIAQQLANQATRAAGNVPSFRQQTLFDRRDANRLLSGTIPVSSRAQVHVATLRKLLWMEEEALLHHDDAQYTIRHQLNLIRGWEDRNQARQAQQRLFKSMLSWATRVRVFGDGVRFIADLRKGRALGPSHVETLLQRMQEAIQTKPKPAAVTPPEPTGNDTLLIDRAVRRVLRRRQD